MLLRPKNDVTRQFLAGLDEKQRELLNSELNFYVLQFSNRGGLVMPIIVELEYVDGSSETLQFPAQVWRYDNQRVAKLVMTEKEVKRVILDPRLQTADVNLDNNTFPPEISKSRFQLFMERQGRRGGGGPNPMQEAGQGNQESEQPAANRGN